MPTTSTIWSRPLFWSCIGLFCLPALMGTPACNGKGCRRPVAEDSDADTDSTAATIKVERKLQISRIIPDQVKPNQPFEFTVLGSGIEAGAAVTVGAAAANSVMVKDETRLSAKSAGLTSGVYDVTVQNQSGESVTLRKALSVEAIQVPLACKSIVVPFGFDEDRLSAGAREVLDAQVECLSGVSGFIRVDGHTDERGSTDYNLALGQRRASVVRDYLATAGVREDRLRARSFGEERPSDPASNEAAWDTNRRVEIEVEE